MTSMRQHLPWISQELKRNTKRRHNKAKRSGKTEHKEAYKAYKTKCQKNIRAVHRDFVTNIVTGDLQSDNKRPFWKYIKAQRQDSFGIPPLKQGSTLFTDSGTKDYILLWGFKSVFTKESPSSSLPDMNGLKTANIAPLTIRPEGVEKLLRGLKPKKASDPVNIPNRVLKELSQELSHAITALLTRTLDTGNVPKDWTDAAISPVFKKGNVHLAGNYRPVSLTCTLFKVLEHIICKHILDHLEAHNILTPLQHGFRRQHAFL